MNAESAFGAYITTKNESAVTDATPHKLISLLLERVSESVATASGAAKRRESALAGEAIGKALNILESLRAFLDHDEGGEIAANLDDLYDYMGRRLLEATSDRNPETFSEVSGLLSQIRQGWDEIPKELRDATQ